MKRYCLPACGVDVVALPEQAADQLAGLISRVYLDPAPGHPSGLITVPLTVLASYVHARCAGSDPLIAICMANIGRMPKGGQLLGFANEWLQALDALRLNVPPLEALL